MSTSTGPIDLAPSADRIMRLIPQVSDDQTPGLFGPAVTLGEDAPLFDRVLARAGRDPRWPPQP